MGNFLGGLPPSSPSFLHANGGMRLVVPGAPSTSIPCTGLVRLGVGLPPPPWLLQPHAAVGGAALLPLPQPRLKPCLKEKTWLGWPTL